ncbi:hypothetical protein TRIP_D450019 [uncultured Paludibacter sp.]|uniref:Uncharacterized protein n=1 Tax=uncultured Paludibacter sp. TaxID=497635 RepID=A0A653AKG0_9BACT|nr:hypothetical protein TRIP_D450019 [uncultured Paludibacter sp.]
MNKYRLVFSNKIVLMILGYALIIKVYPFSSNPTYIPSNNQILEKTGNFPFFNIIKQYNVGDYIPKDQGGKFIQSELFDSENDEYIVKQIQKGALENIYGNPINWIKYEETELEKSVWLSRLYFLPSFGRMYYLTNDSAYISYAMNFLRKWYNENLELFKQKRTKYNWTDMQIAWRCIHLSWFYFLGEKALSETDKEFIIDILDEHSKILLEHFGKQPLNEFNHQSHGALAMLYVGALFPQMEQSKSLIDTSLKILEHHIQYAFYKDGGNVEQMFGYYPFEAHIFRDAYLLCKYNNVEKPNGIDELLVKMQSFISAVKQPNETMPPVNDSYEMPTEVILETLGKINDTLSQNNLCKSKFFNETQIGVIKKRIGNNSWYILANPAKTIGAHMHAGRLAFNIWYNNTPIIRDGGCCNYDNPLLYQWYRTSTAHNTVLIDGKTDEATSTDLLWAPKRETQNKITDFIEDKDFTFLRMHSPADEKTNSSVDWYRSIVLIDSACLILHDFFKTESRHSYELLFHFSDSVNILKGNNTLSIDKNSTKINIFPVDKNIIENLSIKEGFINVDGKNIKAPYAQYTINANGDLHSFIIFTPRNKNEFKIKTLANSDGAGLKIKINNKNRTLLFPNPDCKSLNIFKKNTQNQFEIF